MSEHPQLMEGSRHPVPIHNEIFVLSRHGISFRATSGSLKFEGKGFLYLSTLRIVFVADSRRGSVEAFELPLATIRQESFNQPIFGANNLTGVNPPLEGTSCSTDIKWCLSFNEGGVGTFLPLFFRLLSEMRTLMSREPPQAPPTATALPVAFATTIVQAAYVDPNDPTKLYVSQPEAVTQGTPVAVPVP